MEREDRATDTEVDAAGARSWATVHGRLHARDPADLGPGELEALADAAWWLSRVEESLAARQRAYSGFDAAGDRPRAAYNAWMLFTEYRMIGRAALARGWLQKARRQLHDHPPCEELGYVAYGEAEAAEMVGDIDTALAGAQRVIATGQRCDSRDLVAMGQQLQGRLLVAAGQVDEGMALLDEAMCDVIAGQLRDLTTGWIYCIAVALCFDLADLTRATEWNDAAVAWCESLPTSTPYHGLCRVHRAELLGLGGAWNEADREAGQACTELLAYHPTFAAEAYYVAGEVRRRQGDLAAAEELFRLAHEHGREPQPGLALVRLAQGRIEEAASALRSCLAGDGWNLLTRARILAAQVEVAIAGDDLGTAEAAAAGLAHLGDASAPTLLRAMAAEAEGTVGLADGQGVGLEQLRRARTLWLGLGMPYEAARVRVRVATASLAAGDLDTAQLELRTARSAFQRLGSAADVRRVDQLLSPEAPPPGGLTPREVDVLRLVAAGRTNRGIAEDLVISEHTVARHLNNIFVKLGVSSRAAATAFAYEHDVVRPPGPS